MAHKQTKKTNRNKGGKGKKGLIGIAASHLIRVIMREIRKELKKAI